MGIYEQGSTFALGKIPVLREGKGVGIAASGIMVAEAMKAAKVLEERGISAAVLDCCCWKPLDEATLAQWAGVCGCVVTAENHNVVGGLGSAVASALTKTHPAPVEMVGVQDEVGEDVYKRQGPHRRWRPLSTGHRDIPASPAGKNRWPGSTFPETGWGRWKTGADMPVGP